MLLLGYAICCASCRTTVMQPFIIHVNSIRAVALGVVLTALIQAVIGGIGLGISGVPYAINKVLTQCY